MKKDLYAVKNVLHTPTTKESSHEGIGLIDTATLYANGKYKLVYAEIPPGHSIGTHRHAQTEELYFILEGCAEMYLDGMKVKVGRWDLIPNKPGGTHGLINSSDSAVRILVIEEGRNQDV